MEQRKRKLDLQEQEKDPHLKKSIQSGMNPYTGREYSSRYYDILAGRQGACLMIGQKNVCIHIYDSRYLCRIACLAS